MASRSQRRLRMKYAHITAYVTGIFIALIGICFITVIRGETEQKNAQCSEQTKGIVTDVQASGLKYLTTIEYVAEDVDCSVTGTVKTDLGVGTELDVYYEPLSVKHIYIEGITKTGRNDVITGVVMIFAGCVFVAAGLFLKKPDKPKGE